MQRLFVYGSLRPGGSNEHVLSEIEGEWEPAVVQGRLIEGGWGSSMGYPGLLLVEDGEDIDGHVLSSPNLEKEWARLDAFEGDEYRRVVTTVKLKSGERVPAHVYVLRGAR